VAEHDGNGWVNCRCGSRHWGRHGAAGLLLLRDPSTPAGVAAGPEPDDRREVLLQLRAAWTHQGGRWGLPGGARDSHEDPVAAALREATEEAGVAPDAVTVIGQAPGVDHGDWCYTYVVALAGRSLSISPRTTESDELRWVALDVVQGLPLHPAFAAAWPWLHAGLLR
jgi:8-oxo-dGTP diphosphatase